VTVSGAVLSTTDYTAVVRPLQWLVIGLIFLFFLRVIRAVFVEVRPAGARPTRAERRSKRVTERRQRPARLAAPKRSDKQLFLEVLEPRDQEGKTYQLDGELTVGRSPGCGIPTSYDVYSSTIHARLFQSGNQLWVEDLGSTNGTYVNSERIARATRLVKGDHVQIGATVFEVSR
jgi:pSer/pThr/pTyr-binding forkhead associated (FHA) protein